MPLTEKGQKILNAMKGEYGGKKGESVFYASRNKGTISGVDAVVSNGGGVAVAKTSGPGDGPMTGGEGEVSAMGATNDAASYGERMKQFRGKPVLKAAQDVSFNATKTAEAEKAGAVKGHDEWSPEARKAAAEARKEGVPEGGANVERKPLKNAAKEEERQKNKAAVEKWQKEGRPKPTSWNH